MGNSDKKVKGVADIVFLMDATGSMGNCIQRLKDNVMVFFRSLTEKVAGANSVVPIKDWRAKVVGFRDYEEMLQNRSLMPFMRSLQCRNRALRWKIRECGVLGTMRRVP